MFLKLGLTEIILIDVVNTRFGLKNISELSLDGVKSVWVRIEGKKYHGYWTGSEVKWVEMYPNDL